MDKYKRDGFGDGDDYLRTLSVEFQVPLMWVFRLADTLGSEYDFDELIVELENYSKK